MINFEFLKVCHMHALHLSITSRSVVMIALLSIFFAPQYALSQGLGDDVGGSAGAAGASGSTSATSTKIPFAPLRISNAIESSSAGSASVKEPSVANAQAAGVMKSVPISEFERFVENATGNSLPIFGSDFFTSDAAFRSANNAPVTADYPLGAGDEISIRGWGTLDIDYTTTIDRDGKIALPNIGAIPLAGVRAAEAEKVIRRAIERYYKGVNISVSFGSLKSLTIYVSGQARKPGAYTLSGFSTLVSGLFASGGPNSNGSLRNVQVKRAGRIVATMDLYAFIAHGDKSADMKLLDGDVIYIPPAIGYVAFSGIVNTPAIYELKSPSESIANILSYAGGLPVVADPKRVTLERIDTQQRKARTVEEFALDTYGLHRTLKNGDILTVQSIKPEFSNAVTLRGVISERSPFRPGMRVSDLIPNRERLITRASISRQNEVLPQKTPENIATSSTAKVGTTLDAINFEYASLERINKKDLTVSLLKFNLGQAIDNPSSAENLELQAGDIVTIFSQNDLAIPLEKRQIFVRVEGEVYAPGVYLATPQDTVPSLIAKAGGITHKAYIFGTEFYRDRVRIEQEKNLEKVLRRASEQMAANSALVLSNIGISSDSATAVARLKAQQESEQATIERIRTLKPTGRIALGLSPDANTLDSLPALKLESGDRVVIPTLSDLVHVYGSVSIESALLWKSGMTAQDAIDQAGVSTWADTGETFVMRADGTVRSKSGWSSNATGLKLMPGDSVVVPEKMDKEAGWNKFVRGMKDWAQILTGFGLGAAGLKTLNN